MPQDTAGFSRHSLQGISGRKEYLLSSSHHRFPDSSAVKNPPAMQETWFNFWVQEIPWRRDRLPTLVFLGFPCSSAGKESTSNAGDPSSIPGLGKSPGEGIGYPLQYSWASLVVQMVKNLPAR